MNGRLRSAAYAALYASAMAIVLLVVFVVVAIRQTQTERVAAADRDTQILEQVQRLAQRIDSCVDQTSDDGDPVGECYAQAQRNQADLIGVPRGPINTVTVLATYCQVTKGADTVPEILVCVDAQLRLLKER